MKTIFGRQKSETTHSKKEKTQTERKGRRWFTSKRVIIVCAAVILLECVLPVFVNNLLGYLPLTATVLALIGSYCYLRILAGSLHYDEMSDMTGGTRGRQVEMKVHLENSSVLFFPRIEAYFYVSDIFGNTDSSTSQVITFPPRGSRDFGFDITFDHLGVYNAGLQKMELGDLFGVFTRTVVNDNRYEVTIIPRIVILDRFPISREVVTESEKMKVVTPTDNSEYAGIRDYVAGDPIKSIHWKVSARTRGYVTKVFESYQNTGISIIMDMHAPEYNREQLMGIFDTIVETALSVGTYAHKNGIDSQILYYDRNGETCTITDYDPEAFPAVMRTIPRIYTEKKEKNGEELLQEEALNMYSMGNIAICTANVSDEIIDTLIGIRNRRKNPILFAVIPGDLSEEEKTRQTRTMWRLDEVGISSYILSDAAQLADGQEEVFRYA